MKSYRRVVCVSVLCVIGFYLILSGTMIYQEKHQSKVHYVEMNRIAMKWQETGQLPLDLSPYPHIEAVRVMPLNEMTHSRVEGDPKTIFWGIYNKSGELTTFLCFTYKIEAESSMLKVIAISFVAVLIILGGTLLYSYIIFIKPIASMEGLGEQIGRGNISPIVSMLPQPQFKKLRWGLKMLEDEIGVTTKRNLALERQRQTLLTSIAHGIKTPVANIILYTSAISEKLYPAEKEPELIEKIAENAKRIHTLLEELLHTASKLNYTAQVEKKDFYLADWLKLITLNYSETFALQHIAFEMKSCPNCLIYSDPDALLNVAGNLLDNAIKYGDGVYINMQVDVEEDMLYITVENSGVPIAPAEATSIFKSFYRGSNVKNIQGNGLGLYICRSIIRKLDGSIYAVPKEKSNQFIFAVPIKR